jgi:SAM-dependent methyltransferase
MNSFKEFEKNAWEVKAFRYKDTWGTVTPQVIPVLLELAGEKKGLKLLDVGCGPGHFCDAATAKGLEVIGADYSKAMVEIASNNFPHIKFHQEDAESLSFENNTFDVVTLNYILLHVADQEKTLLEAKRVLKPGGKVIYSNWVAPSNSPGLELIFGALKEYADMTVIPPAPDSFIFSDLAYAESFFKENNFINITSRLFASAWKFPDGDSFYNAVQAGIRMGGLIELQKPEIKEKIREKILREIEKFKNSEGYIVPTPTLIVSATLKL